ncbi:N-acetyltransferase [Arsenicitalea aurantiaca]|uniref:N-acetyltransferase n=1 Tax=Arsenicitalea aurantiaca TaxID=1783274 RepID=A0A433XLT8_9HYPH|nr:N-acetyltransferase [Arsenicitalea aurantiaca]RUT34948.1 N-acetyltransferase [Arsenicitalea aurantiaca]
MLTPSLQAANAAAALPPLGLPTVRLATSDDDAFVDDLQAIAFGPGRFARTAFRVRERFPIDPGLSLIAEVNGVPCGSVWMTPISVGGVDGYLLGPLATHPNFRKRGAGKLLAREVVRLAMSRGDGRFVLLVGDFDYYGPLGFVRVPEGRVIFPGPVDPTRVLLHSDDPSLVDRLEGPIAAFGAGSRS